MLIDLADHVTRPTKVAQGFALEIPVEQTIAERDMLGVVRRWIVDANNKNVACAAALGDSVVSFDNEKFVELETLTSLVHRNRSFRDIVTVATLQDWIVDWTLERRSKSSDLLLSDFLVTKCSTLTTQFRILVPLFNPYIESPFKIGSIELASLSQDDLNRWIALPGTEDGSRDVSKADFTLNRKRNRLRARTVVVTELVGEQARAIEVARERAQFVSMALRFVSKGMFYPSTRSNCVPLGFEVAAVKQHFVFEDGELHGLAEHIDDPESVERWSLGNDEIARERPLWNKLANMYEAESPSKFQEELMQSFALYSRVALSSDVAEKLVHLFAALESFLLKNGTEPIQSSVGDRLALATDCTANERARIAETFREVYGLRSRFVHHGQGPGNADNLTVVKELLGYVWAFYFNLIHNNTQFQTKEEFLAFLDLRKWQ